MKRCSSSRWLLALMPSAPLLSQLARRHQNQCAACQTKQAELDALESRLRLDPDSASAPIPASLRHRLEIALAGEKPRRWAVRAPAPRVWMPAAAAAACAWMLLVSHQPTPSPTPDPRVVNLELSLMQPVRELRHAVSLPRLANAVEQPLTGELEASLDGSRDLLAGMLRSALPEAEAEAVLNHAERWLASNP